MNLTSPVMQLYLIKLSVILEIDPLCDITHFLSMKELSQRLQNFKGMSAKKDSLLQIEEKIRIYANSKYLDRNVRWVFFYFG